MALISGPWASFGFETLKNAIWPKRPPHGLKSTFCTIFIESLLFSRIGVNFSPLSGFRIWKVKNCDLGKTSSALPEKHVLYNFYEKPIVFKYWRKFQSPGRLFDLKRWKMQFGQNVLRMAWKARFVQFSYKAYCFHVLAWISVPPSDFWLWNVEKCDLVKTSSAWAEKDVLYNFHRKPTIFTYWRELHSGNAMFGSKTLKNAIWPKHPPHGLKSMFCTIFIESLLFSRIGVNFSPLSNFWIWKVEKCDLAKTSSAWPEKHVLYNFHGKPLVFTYWREFQSPERFLDLEG